MKISAFLLLLAGTSLLAAPPTPQDDTAIVERGRQVEIKVLVNDTDPDPGDVLTLQPNPTGASHGTLTINGDSIFYTAGPTYGATDEFSYTVSDGTTSATAKVTVATPAVVKGTYTGLATVETDPSIQPGRLQVQLSSLASATTKVTWQDEIFPSKRPRYGSDGRASLVLAKRAGGRLELAFELKPVHAGDTSSPRLVGMLRDLDAGNQTLAVATFDLGHTPNPKDESVDRPAAGYYTSLLAGDVGSSFEEPGGFAVFTISAKTSAARILGQMPDGELFSAGSAYAGRRYVISRKLYKAIRKANPSSKNYVAGEPVYGQPAGLTRGTSIDDEIKGRLSWQRGANPGATYYPNGLAAFQNLLLLARGLKPLRRGTPPPVGFINDGRLTNGEVTLEDGDLPGSIARQVLVKFGPKVVVPKDALAMKMKIAGKTFVFSGSFKHPATGKPVKFKGAFDEAAGEGRGAFEGITERGLVIVRPTP